MEQTAREFLARRSRVIDMLLQVAMQTIGLTGTIRQPLSRIPTSIKSSGTEDCLETFRFRQLRIEDCAAHFQMRIERLAGNKEPHDFA